MNSNFVLYNKKKNIKEISQKYGLMPLTSVILCNREIFDDSEIEKILSSDLRDLNEAKLLPDVDKAAKLIHEAILSNEKILIVGDYDVDGVCATFILYDSLIKLSADVIYYIPDRFTDGYGINNNIIDFAISEKVDLIITCDNGIASGDQITYAKENGIDVIVTDHHDIANIPVDALAVIDPKRDDVETKYPFTEICGAVVAMKLMIRYYELFMNDMNFILDTYLEFAMIATVSDIMPLVNENHIIAKLGLKKVVDTKNFGLKKLIEKAGLLNADKKITTYHIGFIIGPLINAAGRMKNANEAIKLFISKDEAEIEELASTLQRLNAERKKMTEDGTKLAISKIESTYKDDKVYVIYVEGLGEQVAGIVAGRIKDKYNKPTIILTDTTEDLVAKASCRSIEAYDMFNSLNAYGSMLLKFGGHKMAAGFSILKKDIDELRKLLNNECSLSENDFVKKVYIDAEFPFYEMTEGIINDYEKLEPFGQKFAKPQFATKGANMQVTNVYGDEQNVLKLNIEKDMRRFKGVMFSSANEVMNKLSKSSLVDIVYYPKINAYMGNVSIEINIVDFR